MASRGIIAIEYEENTILGRFLHHDAYPYEHAKPYFRSTGEILLESYKDPKKIKKLMRSDILYLKDEIEDCQWQPNPLREWQTIEELLENAEDDVFIEYVYVYTLEGWWNYYRPRDPEATEQTLMPLSVAIAWEKGSRQESRRQFPYADTG